ncbi:peptidoglycan-binding protein [Streptomyces lateritius]|uniref:peptidoglycan-binding protein n=1 Tax=Streptomyces lateritius TaxID=67313 RepID=UPI0016759C0B|nr:peptidoglycan-binding protein [Streptomyces lateritius]GGT89530.1 hypothetical protein GCM10010272_37990 [Streptomyces lateritius]
MEIGGGDRRSEGAPIGGESGPAARRRWGRIAAATGVVVALAASGSAWLAASQARTPEQRAASAAAPPRSSVTVPAEAGPLVDRRTWDGVLSRSTSLVVRGPESGGGAARQVVTRLSVKPGEKLGNGALGAEISGRPLFLLEGAFPAYRDLSEGMQGPDVRQLQQALQQLYGTPVTGTFDDRTARDLKRLYRRAGYRPLLGAEGGGTDSAPGGGGGGGTGVTGTSGTSGTPGGAPPAAGRTVVTLPMSEVVFMGSLPATVGEVSGRVGANASDPLFTVTGGRWQIRIPVTGTALPDFTTLPQGTRATVSGDRLGGAALQATYARVSTGTARHAFFDVAGKVPDSALGSEVKVEAVRRGSSADALVVPVSALWTDPAGTVSVTVVQGERRRHVPVDVALTVGGRAAVTGADPALRKGARLLVGYAYREAGLG